MLKPLTRYQANGNVSVVQIEMTFDGQRRMITLARRVYMLFVKKINPSGKIVIQHKDGDHSNCRSENLIANTYSQVRKDSHASGVRENNFKQEAKQVCQYSLKGKFIAEYSSAVKGIPTSTFIRINEIPTISSGVFLTNVTQNNFSVHCK